MATPDDQPRPDLDAALDAVLPGLTAVSDDAATSSLRRTRTAFAAHPDTGHSAAWRWAVAAAAATVLASALLSRRPEAPAGQLVARPTPSVIATAPGPIVPTAISDPAARVARPASAPRVSRLTERVRATSAPVAESARRPDPLAELVRAVQAIPEDAWARGAAATAVLEVTIAPIAIAPLETPPIPDAPAEPIAPGEP